MFVSRSAEQLGTITGVEGHKSAKLLAWCFHVALQEGGGLAVPGMFRATGATSSLSTWQPLLWRAPPVSKSVRRTSKAEEVHLPQSGLCPL